MSQENNIFHDLRRQINYLRQILRHDKNPIGFFLGAGCPTAIPHPTKKNSVLIPNIEGLTKHIISIFTKNKLKTKFETLYTQLKEDGVKNPNIEQILSRIRQLRDICGSSEVRGLCLSDLDNLEDAICDEICQISAEKLPNHQTPYHNLAAWMSKSREIPIEVFTTNYDLLIEQALEESGVPYFDGFVGSREPFFDTQAIEIDILPSRWSRIWKLHGSINWYLCENGVKRGHIDGDKRRVIHPSHLKYEESRRMPYLALIDRLKAFLKRPATALITCGYSFGDQHINEAIVQSLQGNPTSIALALLYEPLDKYEKAVQLATVRSNLSLLSRDQGIIGTRKGKWNKETIDSSQTGIKCIKEKDEVKEIELHLGDFTEMGKFLVELIGEDKNINE